jgi:glycosyltransferase involved in cell wall biosynthesis
MISVVLPTIPGREALLERAIASVRAQTLPVAALHVVDEPRPDPASYVCERIARARNIGLNKVDTPWVAFLDDDNWWEPNHLASLYAHITEADVIYANSTRVPMDVTDSCFVQYNGPDPNAALVSVIIARNVGGFCETWIPDDSEGGYHSALTGHLYEDLDFWERCQQHGATFLQIPDETWNYEMGPRMDARIGERRHLELYR